MSELPRRIVSRLRRYIGNRRRTKRAKATLTFELSLVDPRVNPNGYRRLPTIEGHTSDLSTTGMGLIVPAIRIGEHYLVGEDRRLHLKVELPDGPVEMNVAPVRYESLEDDENDTGYIIGARISDLSEPDRGRFNEYVKTLLSKQRSKKDI